MSLILKSIKSSPVPSRVNLIFSDSNYLPLLVDDYIKLSLHKNQEIDDSLLTQLSQLTYTYLLREYALRQIALSPKTNKIISNKLALKKNFYLKKYPLLKDRIDHSQALEKILFQLEEKNLLDPLSYVDYLIRRFPHKSKFYLISYLQQQGVPRNTYPDSVFDQLHPQQTITKYLLKKNFTSKDLSDFNTKNKLIASLLRKGFSITEVKKAIDEYLNSK